MPTRVVTPSTALALSLADARDQLRVNDEYETEHLERLIHAAKRAAEGELNRFLLDTVLDETFAQWKGGFCLYLSHSPVLATGDVTSISYFDTDEASQTLANSNYIVNVSQSGKCFIELDPDGTLPSVSTRAWPWTVRYTAGYGTASTDLPENISHALRLLVEDFDRNRGDMAEGKGTVAMGVRRLLAMSEMGAV